MVQSNLPTFNRSAKAQEVCVFAGTGLLGFFVIAIYYALLEVFWHA